MTSSDIQGSDVPRLKNKNIGLLALTSISLALIAPIAFAIGNASSAAAYAGFAMPLIPLIGLIFILFVSVPILEYARFIPFAGGYYGLAELGFGKTIGKWTALGNLTQEIFGASVLNATFVPFIIIEFIYGISHFLIPVWAYFVMGVIITLFSYFVAVNNIKITTWLMIIIAIIGTAITVVISLYTLVVLPHNRFTLAPFTFSASPTGLSGVFLGVILSGMLTFSSYGQILFYGEEARAPTKTVWRAIILAVVIAGLVGILAMYTEAISIGKTHLGTVVSALIPAIPAFAPYVGDLVMYIFVAVAVADFIILVPAITGAGGRLMYALSRDGFFTKRVGKYFFHLNKNNMPDHGALVISLISLAIYFTVAPLMIYLYGYLDGILYAYFIIGGVYVLVWYLHHIIADLAMIRALPKKFGEKLTTPRNFFIAIVSPLVGAAILVYSFVLGYDSFSEPYFGATVITITVIVLLLIWTLYKRHKHTLGESFISESLNEYIKNGK